MYVNQPGDDYIRSVIIVDTISATGDQDDPQDE